MGHIKKRAKKEKQRKRRFMWTAQLHKRFVAAVFDQGVKGATPKLLHELMTPAPPELTTDHIKSHLQKYRLNIQSSRAKFMAEYERTATGMEPHEDEEVAPDCGMGYPMSSPMTPIGEAAASVPDTDSSSAAETSSTPQHDPEREPGTVELLRTVHEQQDTIKKLTAMVQASLSHYSAGPFPVPGSMTPRSVYPTPLPSPVSCTSLHSGAHMLHHHHQHRMALVEPPKAPPVPASLLEEWRGGHTELDEDPFGDCLGFDSALPLSF